MSSPTKELCTLRKKQPIWTSNFTNTICRRDCHFNAVYSWQPCQRSLLVSVWSYFWTFYSISSVYRPVFMQVSYSSNYCCFVIYFVIRRCGDYSFTLPPKIDQAIFGSLWCHMKFWIVFLFLFFLNATGILIGIDWFCRSLWIVWSTGLPWWLRR